MAKYVKVEPKKFRENGDYTIGDLTNKEPSCGNGRVTVRKYKSL